MNKIYVGVQNNAVTLLLCKNCETTFYCFVHQHGRLITWMQTKNIGRLFACVRKSQLNDYQTEKKLPTYFVASILRIENQNNRKQVKK